MIFIDYSDKRPIYEQVEERIRSLIVNGVLREHEKIPSVRTLAMELSINPNTIQRAYAELERKGMIYSIKGRGNFVNINSEIIEIEKSKRLNDLKVQMKHCKDMGLSYHEMETCLRETFGEVEK